jgi:hypothetical protein
VGGVESLKGVPGVSCVAEGDAVVALFHEANEVEAWGGLEAGGVVGGVSLRPWLVSGGFPVSGGALQPPSGHRVGGDEARFFLPACH